MSLRTSIQRFFGIQPTNPFPGLMPVDDFDLVDQLVMVETELKATKAALAFQDEETDRLGAKIALSEQAIVHLHDLLPDDAVIKDDGSSTFQHIAEVLKKQLRKGKSLKLAQ